jgi:hypothetical protein
VKQRRYSVGRSVECGVWCVDSWAWHRRGMDGDSVQVGPGSKVLREGSGAGLREGIGEGLEGQSEKRSDNVTVRRGERSRGSQRKSWSRESMEPRTREEPSLRVPVLVAERGQARRSPSVWALIICLATPITLFCPPARPSGPRVPNHAHLRVPLTSPCSIRQFVAEAEKEEKKGH